MDNFLKYLGFGLIAVGGVIVVFGGIGGLVYAIVANVPATPITALTGGVGMLLAVSGLIPMTIRLWL